MKRWSLVVGNVCIVGIFCITFLLVSLSLARDRFENAIYITFLVAAGILGVFSLYYVHCLLNVLYLIYAKRFCTKYGFRPVRWRVGMAFNTRGIKTEYSIVQLDCVDSQSQKRFVSLLVWAFGILTGAEE
jgi:hypothetical protein